MSDYTPNLNKGTMHNNKYKKKDTDPDYRGQINVDGVVKELSGWVNTDKNGSKYLNIAVKEPYVKPDVQAPAPQQQPPAVASTPDLDDKIPF